MRFLILLLLFISCDVSNQKTEKVVVKYVSPVELELEELQGDKLKLASRLYDLNKGLYEFEKDREIELIVLLGQINEYKIGRFNSKRESELKDVKLKLKFCQKRCDSLKNEMNKYLDFIY